MNTSVRQRPSVSRAPRRSALWLALGLLFFIQLASATHHHDEHSVKTHDCVICSQLQTVKHSTVGEFQFVPLQPAPYFHFVAAQVASVTDFPLRPPARAPPAVSLTV